MQLLRAGLLLLVLISTRVSALDAEQPFADPAQQVLYVQLINEVRCLVCQNQPIADSNAPLASDLRREIRALIETGKTENDIKLFLTERYGDFVLYRPRFGGPALLLWLAPGILLCIGLLALARILRRRLTLPYAESAPGERDTSQDRPAP